LKIAFLVTRLEKPSARYRVLQFIPSFNNNGIETEVFVIPQSHWDRIKLFRKLKNFDIVFLQKKIFHLLEFTILRRQSRLLVYDFDDAVMYHDPKKKNKFSQIRQHNFRRTVKNADIVIAGNEYLKNLALRENPSTYSIPTSINMDRYTEKQQLKSSDALVIGWIGSKATLFYLEGLKHVWDRIGELFPHIKLKIVSDMFFDCGKIPVIKKSWNYDEEIEDLHTIDIGLMPLTDDPWSQGKCGFKLLQYMAVGIPAVCSPVGVNSQIVHDGINSFLARDSIEWIEKLSVLIENSHVRDRMGKRARETVIKYYSIELASRKLIELLKALNTRNPRIRD